MSISPKEILSNRIFVQEIANLGNFVQQKFIPLTFCPTEFFPKKIVKLRIFFQNNFFPQKSLPKEIFTNYTYFHRYRCPKIGNNFQRKFFHSEFISNKSGLFTYLNPKKTDFMMKVKLSTIFQRNNVNRNFLPKKKYLQEFFSKERMSTRIFFQRQIVKRNLFPKKNCQQEFFSKEKISKGIFSQ